MNKYKYIGNGAGVPGLPHEITQAEIDELNGDQLADFENALVKDLYVEITDDPKPVRKSQITVGTQGSVSDQGHTPEGE